MASNCGRYAEKGDEDWAGKYGACWVHICRGPSDPVAAAVWSQRDDDGAPAVDGPSNEYVEELSSVQAFPLNGSLNDRNTQAYGKLYEIPNFNNNNDSSNNNNLAVRQHEHIIILMLISASQPVSPFASLTQRKGRRYEVDGGGSGGREVGNVSGWKSGIIIIIGWIGLPIMGRFHGWMGGGRGKGGGGTAAASVAEHEHPNIIISSIWCVIFVAFPRSLSLFWVVGYGGRLVGLRASSQSSSSSSASYTCWPNINQMILLLH